MDTIEPGGSGDPPGMNPTYPKSKPGQDKSPDYAASLPAAAVGMQRTLRQPAYAPPNWETPSVCTEEDEADVGVPPPPVPFSAPPSHAITTAGLAVSVTNGDEFLELTRGINDLRDMLQDVIERLPVVQTTEVPRRLSSTKAPEPAQTSAAAAQPYPRERRTVFEPTHMWVSLAIASAFGTTIVFLASLNTHAWPWPLAVMLALILIPVGISGGFTTHR